MKRTISPLLFIAAVVIVLTPPIASAQDEAKASAPAPATEAVTAADPEIPVEVLTKLLRAPTRDELAVEADAWRDLLRQNIDSIAQAEIASLSEKVEEIAESDAAATAVETDETASGEALNDQMAALTDQKAGLVERYGIVLDALEKKGGDAAEHRSYADAVSEIQIEVKDVSATWAALRGWITSKEGGIKWGVKALKFCAILLVFWVLAAVIGRTVRKTTAMHREMSSLLKRFLNNLARRAVMLVGFLIALSSLGFNVGALFALIGGGAFIIGFALQDTLGNFAAGIMLLVYRPFDVADIVEIGGVTGKVDKVSLVSTTIRTFDNKVVLVPNKQVWGQVITNASASGERRVDMVFGIGYDDDLKAAEDILKRIVDENDKILSEPAPDIRIDALADSSVNFICRPWALTDDYWTVYADVTGKVKQEFDSAGISFPYPQQDVHMHQTSTSA